MKKIIIALLLLPTTYVGRAQEPKKASAVLIIKFPSGKEKVTKNFFISAHDVESMEMVPSTDIKKYSPDANVAMFITPKSYVKLLTLNEFYSLRNIEQKYRYKISINGEALADTSNFLIYDPVVKAIVKKDNGIDILVKYNTPKPKK